MGHPLTAIRKKRGLTKQQLAEAAGLDRSTVSKIESGTRGSLWSYRRLAKVLKLDYRRLMPAEK